MPMIETKDGTRLYAKVWGQGRPVVLIHGWPLSGDSWDPITNALADAGYKAIAYDRRGFGRSDQPSDGYDYDTFADDLSAVLEYCAGGQDAALVGFSMGGGEIARYLSRHGGKGVSKVALVSSVVPYMLKTDDNPDGVPQATFDEMTAGMKADRAKFFSSFFDDFFGVGMVSSPVSDEVLDLAWMTAMQAGLRPTLASAKAFATTDFRPDLPSFTVPTLVIHGTADKTVPIDTSGRALAKAVPQAQLIEYDGEPHGVFATQTQRLTDDLMAFLGGDSQAAGIDLGQVPAAAQQEVLDEVTRESMARSASMI
ncbi:alpha/beta fold hydrolase [Parablastomonas sp. CN1-191]|uniref:alpha/beta fold hydrolase n=1 Tax=Parablastomonas sp. CN1-191 TaxID=3400908 RepID=UPI003BF8B6F0